VSYGVLGGVISQSPPPTPTEPEPITPETIRTKKLKDKLHTWVYALVDRVEKKTAEGPNESRFVRDGKAEIKVTVSKLSARILEKIRQTGFEIVSEKNGVIRGRIGIDRIASLAELDEITLILPAA